MAFEIHPLSMVPQELRHTPRSRAQRRAHGDGQRQRPRHYRHRPDRRSRNLRHPGKQSPNHDRRGRCGIKEILSIFQHDFDFGPPNASAHEITEKSCITERIGFGRFGDLTCFCRKRFGDFYGFCRKRFGDLLFLCYITGVYETRRPVQ